MKNRKCDSCNTKENMDELYKVEDEYYCRYCVMDRLSDKGVIGLYFDNSEEKGIEVRW